MVVPSQGVERLVGRLDRRVVSPVGGVVAGLAGQPAAGMASVRTLLLAGRANGPRSPGFEEFAGEIGQAGWRGLVVLSDANSSAEAAT